MSNRIAISEIYGPVLQGEGPTAGRATIFVRTFGCDSRCTQCDSMYAVDPSHPDAKYEQLTPQEIVDRIRAISTTLPVTFSGGNPALWDMAPVLKLLEGQPAWIETQGTYWREWLTQLHGVVVSPKGPFMDDVRRLPILYKQFVDRIDPFRLAWKVVIGATYDFDFADQIAKAYPQVPMYLSLGAMAHWDTIKLLERYRILQEELISGRWPSLENAVFLPQLHVLTYAHERGR